jgi:hypothetical protein
MAWRTFVWHRMAAQVNLQKWVIKAVIRIMRLRYELLDNGSIARLVLK